MTGSNFDVVGATVLLKYGQATCTLDMLKIQFGQWLALHLVKYMLRLVNIHHLCIACLATDL